MLRPYVAGFGVIPRVGRLTTPLSVTATAVTITPPAGVLAGDLIVIQDRARAATAPAPTAVTPTGFTNVTNNTINTDRQMVSYKIANGTEGGVAITGMNAGGGGSHSKQVYVFRGDNPIRQVAVASINSEVTDGNPAAQNVTASSGPASLLVIAAYGSAATINPRTFTPSKDGEITSTDVNNESYLAYKVYNLEPADVSIDMDDEGSSNTLQSFYLALS